MHAFIHHPFHQFNLPETPRALLDLLMLSLPGARGFRFELSMRSG